MSFISASAIAQNSWSNDFSEQLRSITALKLSR